MTNPSPNLLDLFDPTKDAFDNLIGLVKANNLPNYQTVPPTQGFDASRQHVRLGQVSTVDADERGRNTHVMMSTIPGRARGGPWKLHYHRPSFRKFVVVDTVNFVYFLKPSDLDASGNRIKDPEALKKSILATLFGVAAATTVGCHDEFKLTIATDWSRPVSGIETVVTLEVVDQSWLFVLDEKLTFTLRWPTNQKVVSLDTITETKLGGFTQ